MQYDAFLNAVKALNTDSRFYGNEVLYNMAQKENLGDQRHLAGSMWLIGRSYAASPQRRYYGKNSEVILKSDDDGRDFFFSYIAREMAMDWLALAPDSEFSFDGSDKDMQLLQQSVEMVLQFNLALSKAIEKFDGVGENSKDFCSNHISFCSKYLHFYYPHHVFIIDSYAEAGAGQLFKSAQNKKAGYICKPDGSIAVDDPLDTDVYNVFDRKYAKQQGLVLAGWMEQTIAQYERRKRSPQDWNKAEGYISHCVRSYLLACKMKDADIAPESQLPDRELCSMPRLTDAIFLNVKQK